MVFVENLWLKQFPLPKIRVQTSLKIPPNHATEKAHSCFHIEFSGHTNLPLDIGLPQKYPRKAFQQTDDSSRYRKNHDDGLKYQLHSLKNHRVEFEPLRRDQQQHCHIGFANKSQTIFDRKRQLIALGVGERRGTQHVTLTLVGVEKKLDCSN